MAFFEIQEILARWHEQSRIPDKLEEACQTRLCDVLQRLKVEGSEAIGGGDLAGLVRHVLFNEATRIAHPILRVPRGNPWPERSQWESYGLTVISEETKCFVLEPGEEWRPNWLENTEAYSPLKATFAGEMRRRREALPADPNIFQEFGFHCYTSLGQQQAIRSVFCSRPGSILLINLPTGDGKSLVMYAPAFNQAQRTGVTVVVVPTVALALDQERQIWGFLERNGEQRYAMGWHSGLNRAERAEIVGRIAAGTQRIIFAAPESLVGPLLRPLSQAAKVGLLRYFMFDEAHLIASWGNEFRPEFQSVAGVRRNLLALCPPDQKFRTLFLTATLTEEAATTIATMLSKGEKLEVISAVHLRPEPEYWIHKAAFQEKQIVRVLELARMAPRPFLLYVTRRDHAEAWEQRLRTQLDLKRVASFHGATQSDKRRHVLDEWRNGNLDVVVATSAFGLGMDKADVRCVIHACVPETVDRFYQEVGRAGRDGKACASFLVWTDEDRQCAKSLAGDRVITVDKGLVRWEQMLHDGKHLEGERWMLDLCSRPPGILQDSEANKAWNLRTLILLARSGIITLEASEPPDIQQMTGESMEEFEARRLEELNGFYSTCTVTTLHPRHWDRDVWAGMVENERRRTVECDRRDWRLLDELLKGRRKLADILKEVYTISPSTPIGRSHPPVAACGGCEPCRTGGDITRCSDYLPPEADPITDTMQVASPSLQRAFAKSGCHSGFIAVSYEVPDGQRALRRWIDELNAIILRPLVEAGVIEIAVPASWLQKSEIRQLYRKSPIGFLVLRSIDETDSTTGELQVPRVSILEPKSNPVPIPQHVFQIQRPVHLVLFPENAPESVGSSRLYCDVSRHLKRKDLLRSLNQ